MIKLKATLFLVMLHSFNIHCGELVTRFTQHVNPKNVAITAGTVATAYAGYKAYQAYCARLKKIKHDLDQARVINRGLFTKGFEINKDTVFVFDINDFIAKADNLKKIKIALSNPVFRIALLYPRIFPVLLSECRKGSYTQQMFNEIKKLYSDDENIEKMEKLAALVSSQMTPIQETFDFVKQLVQDGRRVVFASNMETNVWHEFISQPEFECFNECGHYSPCLKNKWACKPSENYFNGLLYMIEDTYFNRQPLTHVHDAQELNSYHTYTTPSNILYIDPKSEHAAIAVRIGMPAYVFTKLDTLKSVLTDREQSLKSSGASSVKGRDFLIPYND